MRDSVTFHASRITPHVSLGTRKNFPYPGRVIVLLRWVGILNVAVWFGAVVFFTTGVVPALFSQEVHAILGEQNYKVFAGRLAMAVISRYFFLHYWCASIALVHQLAERFYLGKPLDKLNFGLLVGLCCFSLIGGAGLAPRLKTLHTIQYGRNDLYSPAQKAQAERAFHVWHGVSYGLNLLVLGGLAVYLWRMANPADSLRFVPAGKFRS